MCAKTMLSWWDESICIYSGQFGCFRKGCVVMLAEISQNSACWTDNLLMCAGDFAYLPKMQFLNLGGVLLCLWITFQNNLGLGGIWWCLVFYFGFRVFFHSCYIANHWRTHVLGGGFPSSIPEEEARAFLATWLLRSGVCQIFLFFHPIV